MSTINEFIETISLQPDSVIELEDGQQFVAILQGTAWISANGEDIIAEPGTDLWLETSGHPAVVSALRNQPVSLQIRKKVAVLAA